MKKIFLILVIIFSLATIYACDTSSGDASSTLKSDKDAMLSYGEFTDSDYLYNQMTLSSDGKDIPIYNCKINFSHTWNAEAPQRMNNGVAIVSIKGKVKFTITTVFKIKSVCTIRPIAKNVPLEIDEDNKQVSFLISEPGQYTIEFSNDRTLHFFVNEYGIYDEYKEVSNVLYFGPGVHNKDNDKRISSDNLVHLNSNQTVYIDEGAIVEAGFIAVQKENITIVGNGIISGACFDRSATTNTKLIPFEFNYCKNLKFYGITNLDPAGWCYNLYFGENIEIDNIKIISSRSNGDGVSIQSCQNVTCDNSFVRSWDDSLVVKNYPNWSNRDIEGTTRNVTFSNCVIWTDLAQSMEVGYECVGEVMEDIHFIDITVLHNYHQAVISIHNGNNANIKNVTYKNIIVEDASMGKGSGRNVLIELTAEFSSTWSNGHKVTALGSVSDVTIENMQVLSANNPKLVFRGSVDSRAGYNNTEHYVSNVTIKDLYIEGVKIDSSYSNIESTYTNNLTFK